MRKFLAADAYINSIFTITPEGLKQHGIYGLILDIDNTLVATHTKEADEKVIRYIKSLNENGIKTVIVSNAKRERVELFSRPFNIEYVYKALKPFGRGFDVAIKKMGLPREQVAIIGDQLFTDVLGGNFKGIHSILLKPIDLNEPLPIKFKRLFEKPFLSKRVFTDKY